MGTAKKLKPDLKEAFDKWWKSRNEPAHVYEPKLMAQAAFEAGAEEQEEKDWLFNTLVRTTVSGFLTCLDAMRNENIGLMKAAIRNGCNEILEAVKRRERENSSSN